MKVFGRLLKWVFIGFAVLLVLLGVLFGLLQTETGQRQLAKGLSHLLSSGPDSRVEIEGIEGLVPFDFRVQRVIFEDRAGMWLNVDEALFHWSPLRLLQGRIFVDEAGAALVRLDRLPPAEEKAGGKKKAPTWPPDIPPFVVETFRVDRLSLGGPILGRAAEFRVSGRMRSLAEEPGLSASFEIARLDRPDTGARIHWRLQGKTPSVQLRAELQEGEDSLLLQAAGYDDLGGVRVQLEGQGPLTDWQGRCTAHVEGFGSVVLNMELDLGPELGFHAEGAAEIAAERIPPSASPLLADNKAQLTLAGKYSKAQILEIERSWIDTGRVRLELSGELDLGENRTNSRFSLDLADMAYLPAKVEMNGRLSVDGQISGPLMQPELGLSVLAENIEVADLRAERLAGDLDVAFLEPLNSSFPGLHVRGNGRLNGLADGEDKPLLPEPQVGWSLDVTVPDPELLEVGEFAATGQSFRVGYDGKARPVAASFDGELDVQLLDLHQFTPIWGQGSTGRLTAAVSGSGRTQTVTAKIQGEVDRPSAVPPAVQSVLGPRISYHADLRLSEQQILHLTDLQVMLAESTLTGDAVLDLNERTLDGRGDLGLPLASLAEAASMPLQGDLQVHWQVLGSLQSPEIEIRASGKELLVADQTLEHIQLALKAVNLEADPAGTVAVDAERGDVFLKTNSRYALADSMLRLSELEIRVPGAAAAGELAWNLQNMTIHGRLEGEAVDLADLPVDPDLRGSLAFEVLFDPKESGQEVLVQATAEDLAALQTRVKRLDLHAGVTDLFHRRRARIEFSAADLVKADLQLNDLTIQMEGYPERASFTGKARGRYGSTLEVDFKGEAMLAQTDKTLTLNELQGRFDAFSYSLDDALVLHKRRERFVLEQVRLSVGPGRLSAGGELGPKRLSFEGDFQAFPLELLHLFGVADMTGSASGELRVSGSPDRPDVNLHLQVDEAKIQGAAYEEVPPVSLQTQVVLTDNRLTADGVLKGLFEQPVEAGLVCPVRVSFAPFDFGLPEKGQLDGFLSAEADLGSVTRLLHLDDQKLEGEAKIDLGLGGSMEDPKGDGKIRVADGLYENYRTGTLVQELGLEATFAGHRLTIERAEGNDGTGGRIEAAGHLDLLPAERFPLRIDLTLQQMTLVRQDYYTAAADGQLQFRGDTRQLQLTGRAQLGPAEIGIPERLPASVTELEVVEANAPEAAGIKPEPDNKEPETKAEDDLNVKLDLQVEVPGRVYVRGRGLESEWQGKLDVQGSAAEPVIRGVLSVVRGHFNFLGKRFDLASGEIRFHGGSPPTPDIDVLGEYQRGDLTARIHLTGTPENLNLSLESDPPLPEDEILAQVLFNRSAAKINPIQALKLAEALNTLRGGGGGAGVLGRVRKLTGLDALDIEMPEEEGGPNLSVGKYLSEDVYIQLDKGLESSEGDQVKVEVEVLPNINMESSVGTESQGRGGINWKYDY